MLYSIDIMMFDFSNLLDDLCGRRIGSFRGCSRAEIAGHHHAAVFFKSGRAPPLLKVHGLW